MTDAKVNIDRELELIDGMIEVQLHHAKQCDGIANRTMAEKQKGWDMERVALLRKMRSALAADPSMDTVLRNAARRSATIVDRGRMVQPVEPVAWRINTLEDVGLPANWHYFDDEPGESAFTVQPLYAAPPAPAAVPPGWKLVPIEPTRAMIASGAVALMKASHSDIDPTMEEVTAAYRAMTAAVKPATAVPLTDERIVELFRETFLAHTDPLGKDNMTIAFARAIERAHSIAAGDKLCGG